MKVLIDSENIDTLIITDSEFGVEANCSGNICWICESKQDITKHHTIPKHLKPKKNVVVPVCLPCHKKINEADLTGIQAFGYKIHQKVKELTKEMGVWIWNSNQIISKHKVEKK